MADILDAVAGAAGAAAFDGNITSMPPISWAAYTEKRFFQECAMILFANTNFTNETNIQKAANDAVSRAQTLTSVINSVGGFES